MKKQYYEPFVKRLDLSVLGDEHEPVIIQMPSKHIKMASELNPETAEWDIRNPAGVNIERILVVGLGAQEGYGPNVNGDGFHEEHLLAVPKDVYLGKKPYDKPMYKTFTDFSKLYKHHKNRMHDQAFGEIPFVAYNPKMRRVEIVVDLYADEKNNIDILENLAKNIFPAVSMGFRCVPPGTMIKTEKGWRLIEKIKISDLVYTHTGELQMVTKLYLNDSPKTLLAIRVVGDYRILSLTKNHEVWTIKRSEVLTTGKSDPEKKVNAKPMWACIEHAKVGDYLTEQVYDPKVDIDYNIDENLAYLFGLYVGDGSLSNENRYGKKISAISIECDINHDLIYRKIAKACFDLGYSSSYSHTTKNTLRAIIRNKEFGKLAKRLFGTGSHDKGIHSSVFSWPDNCKKAFLGGYLDSDGHFNKDKGIGRIASVNSSLIEDTKQLAWSAEINCTVHRDYIGNTNGSFSSNTEYAIILSFPKSSMSGFATYCQKVPNRYDFSSGQGGLNFFFKIDEKLYIAKRINKIDEIESEYKKIHNLEVAHDNSYIAEGIIVHNCVPGDVCQICLNYDKPFPTRAHYCDHLRNHMLQIDQETGKLIYAINHNGYFFDLSIVKKPADRIAWGMKRLSRTRLGKGGNGKKELAIVQKTASAIGMDFQGYSSKLAEEDGTVAIVKLMEKEIPKKEAEVEIVPDGVKNVIENDPDPYFARYGLKLANRTDLPISNEILDYITKKYPLKVAFTTMVSCGIWPKPQEFQRMVLVNAGQEKYADYLEKENIIFDLDAVEEPDYTYDITTGKFDPKLAESLRKFGVLDQRSYYAPFLMKRAAMIKEAITAREFFDKYPIIPNPLPRKKLPENYQQQMITQGIATSPVGQYYTRNPNPVMNDGRYVSAQPAGTSIVHKTNPIIPLAILGALYAGGRWLTGFTRSGPLSKAMSGNPLVLAGAFGATAVLTWIAGRIGIPRPVKTGSVGSVVAKAKSTAASLGKDYAVYILAGVGLSYGLAARAENKRIIGRQPNIIEEAAEKRPALGAALIGLATGAGARTLVRKFASDELEMLEQGIMANDLIIGEYDHDYIDKMARLSLNHSAVMLKK